MMRVRRIIMLIAPLAVAVGAPSGPVHAERANGPCRQDIERLCPGITPGSGAYKRCLEQHASELSPACQERVKQMKARAAKWRQACQDDVHKFCAQVEPGHGNIRQCLHQHHDELSQTCKDQIAQHRHGQRRHAPTPTPGSPPGAP
jgi:hypothetical protein